LLGDSLISDVDRAVIMVHRTTVSDCRGPWPRPTVPSRH
jgi:hypothetical protein